MEDSLPGAAVVLLRDPAAHGGSTDWLGLWELPEEMPAVSFDAPRDVSDQPFLWRAELPGEPGGALGIVTAGESQVSLTDAALGASDSRLAALVDSLETLVLQPGMAFDVVPEQRLATVLRQPEAELLVLLGTLQETQAARSEGGISLGIGVNLSGIPVAQALRIFLEMKRLLTYYAWVETRVGARSIAVTSIDWSGALRTVWRVDLTANEALLHRRVLELALRSRKALLRSCTLTCALALKLSGLLATPLGAALVIPAVWQYIKQIREELGDPQRGQEQGGGQNS